MKNKQLLTIFLIVFIDLLGFGIILPLLPYITEKYGGNPFEVGMLASTYSFFQLIAAPLLGRLSDRYGRKKILIISQAGSAIGYLILGLANNLPLLFLSRIIDGITGGNISIAQAYIADVTDKKNRAKGMGLIGAAFGLGFIFGPAIGGILAKINFSVPAYFAFAVSLLTVFLTSIFLKETVDISKAGGSPKTKLSLAEIKRILSTYPIGILIISFFIFNTAISLFQGIFALWTEKSFKFNPSENGWLFAYLGIIGVIIQLVILPLLLKKTEEKTLLKIAQLVLFIGLLLLVVINNSNQLFIVLPLISFGQGLINPLTQSISSENIIKEEQGGTMGIIQGAGSLGRIIGPAIGGFLFFAFGKNIPFILSAILIFFVFNWLVIKLK